MLGVNMKGFLLPAFVVFICFATVSSDLFTSIADLDRVLLAERHLTTDLRSYIAKEEQRIQWLKNIADVYDEHSQEALSEEAESYLGNPLNAFLLVKRFTKDWQRVETLIRNNTSDMFLNSISETLSNFPDEEDLPGAARALFRLQDTYTLSTTSLANGEIQGAKKSPVLSAGDCFDLGQVAYNDGDFYHTILWMDQTIQKLENETEPSADLAWTLDYLSYAAYVQGNIKMALNYTIQWLTLDPDNQRAHDNKAHYVHLIHEDQEDCGEKCTDEEDATFDQEAIKNERILDEYRKSGEFADYEAICRGEEVPHLVNPYKHKLVCRYGRHHPFFMYAPLKEEQMYLDPDIRFYHQLMTDSEMARIKELSMPKLHRSGVFLTEQVSKKEQEYRISKSAWLRDDLDPIIRRVSLRTAAMANLTLDTAEEFQVLNYGIGGQYEPHWDFAREMELSTLDPFAGNRIATAIYYMSNVDAGGATVFNQLGVRVVPEKGSVALWYNLMRNGAGDYRTQHAGCPVLSGSKWVCNKWFHERAQDFIRPCSMNPNE